jgi:aminoglycoside phosphotransferase (APT) family kinase protein
LDYLAAGQPRGRETWGDWQISPVPGGANNLLYRACGPPGELAVKFTLRDRRKRAEREYSALLALHQAGSVLAPRPVLLETERYALPVVVQEWLAGEVNPEPPEDDAGWTRLLEHYAAIHTLRPEATPVQLRKAVVNFASARQGVITVQRMAACLPEQGRPAGVIRCLRGLEAARFPHWPPPAPALCRVDANILNFVRRPGPWASVDWENSGWGDPAFEIADLLSHPAYLDVPAGRKAWIVDCYCRLAGQPGATRRIQVYYAIMLAWWVARLARYLYEVPRGLDPRLVERSPDWEADMRTKLGRYEELAIQALEDC